MEEQFRGRLWGAADETEVAQTVDEFRQAWERAENTADACA